MTDQPNRHRRRRGPRFRAVVRGCAAALALTTLAACASQNSDAETDTDNPLYEAAKADGSLTWYTSVDTDTAEATAQAFEERYPGVSVQVQRLTTGQVTARYSQERTAGSSPADVVTVGDPEFFVSGREDGWFETKPELPSLDGWPKDSYDQGVALVSIVPLGVTYNTNLVKEPPQQWEDLLDPAYKGKIQFGDPRNVPAYLQLDYLLSRELGDDFLEKIAAQKPAIFPSIVNATQTVASGGAELSVPGTRPTTELVKAKGAPVEFIALSPTVGVEFSTALATDAPNADAGRLFYDYLLSKAGQEELNVNTVSPLGALPGTDPKPDGYEQIAPDEADAQRSTILGQLGLR
ncbi:extracellular solute-binding protein [Prauserella oleivorans]|uniref:Extracellular solute-binding protein n=1 Tax=Prauserella oleivorans TaxID=1478153 RepID=A0ABW5WB42_9PSEU